MSFKDQVPCNTDLLQSAKFILIFPRLPFTQFFCQAANVPGIATTPTSQPTPFSNLPIPGDKLQYEPLDIEFLLDEELLSWIQVHDWMRGIAFPKEFAEYSKLKDQSRYSQQVDHPQYADAELISLSALGEHKVKFKFLDLFPISLGGISYDIRVGSEKIMTSTATFKFSRYDIITG